MGQTLSEPVTEKQSTTCQDTRYLVGSSCMQGWRVSMDDSHTHILSLPDDPGTAFFAVYDGHGGANIAEYAGKHLHKFITARPEYHLGNIEEALKQGFLDLDQAMLEQDMLQEKVAGSTAVCVLIKENTLYCANVGDSRAIASVRGAVEMLSYDHKPNNEEELRRITAGGGWVQLNRVNGNLALSRALGDYVFKRNYRLSPQEQIVTAFPDVQVRQVNDDWEFIVIACDGIWEVLSNEEVISFCRVRLVSGWEPAAVCEALMQRCLAPNCATGGLGCDNMTVLIICLAPFPRQVDQGGKTPPRKKSIPPLVRNAPHHFASTNPLSDKIRVKSQDRVYFPKRDDESDYTFSRRLTKRQLGTCSLGLGVIDPRYFNAYLRSCRDEQHMSVRHFYQNACNHSDASVSCDVCHRSDANSSSGRTRAVFRKSKKATENLKLFASLGTI